MSLCKSYENTLRKTRSRISGEPERKKMGVNDTSKVNYRYLKKEELIERGKSKAIKTTMKMSILISTCIKDEGVKVDSTQHETLSRVIETTEQDLDKNSPQWLLWQQQKEQSSKKGSRGMRWHLFIIRWCLSVYSSSAAKV